MVQAYTLVALEWKPARWDDIGSLPDQVVRDYFTIRSGMAAARDPYGWYRTVGLVSLAHMFRHGPDGPETIARCGVERLPDAVYRESDDPPLCQFCDAKDKGKPTSVGTIGDLEEEERLLASGG